VRAETRHQLKQDAFSRVTIGAAEKTADWTVEHRTTLIVSAVVALILIGGVAGGLLGSTIGSGTGRTVATIAGAAGGAYVGNQVQKNAQQKNVVTSTEHRCKTVNDTTEKLVGYDVTYRLEGKEGTLRTTFKPGPTLPVKDGQVIATPPTSG